MGVVVTEIKWPTKADIFSIWPFTGIVSQPSGLPSLLVPSSFLLAVEAFLQHTLARELESRLSDPPATHCSPQWNQELRFKIVMPESQDLNPSLSQTKLNR